MKAFKIRDLATKAVANVGAGAFSGVGLIGPDQDPDDFPPGILPYIMLSKVQSQLDSLREFAGREAEIDIEMLDRVALDIGRRIVASQFALGTQLCTIDMPTCAANPRISPVASLANEITNFDVAFARANLERQLEHIDRWEKQVA